ncbi:zinc finger FYVE domain-containing protein 9-like isoform X2 [Gordionus sp. m RMFG-2023]|uniref:zinc finger FYVE domain-containing protein 9-like isoform X2 n=1 Tax=Gordionus sp. m RMFG-2023 TaxID=3053472 RepID=UPI0031FCC957
MHNNSFSNSIEEKNNFSINNTNCCNMLDCANDDIFLLPNQDIKQNSKKNIQKSYSGNDMPATTSLEDYIDGLHNFNLSLATNSSNNDTTNQNNYANKTISNITSLNNENESTSDKNNDYSYNDKSPHKINSMLGYIKPFWIPDDQTDCCMYCDQKFTIVKRRHHCRACGKILCANCCNKKLVLPSMDFKLSRVCMACFQLLENDIDFSPSNTSTNNYEYNENSSPRTIHNAEIFNSNTNKLPNDNSVKTFSSPDPLKPEQYCSTLPPMMQVLNSKVSATPPVVYVPVMNKQGILKNNSNTKISTSTIHHRTSSNPTRDKSIYSSSKSHGSPSISCKSDNTEIDQNTNNNNNKLKKQVMFSDGVRPGGDLSLLGDNMVKASPSSTTKTKMKYGKRPKNDANVNNDSTFLILPAIHHIPPPILRFNSDTSDLLNIYSRGIIPTNSSTSSDDLPSSITLSICSNLKLLAKINDLSCCQPGTEDYLILATRGMCNVAQQEIIAVFPITPLRNYAHDEQTIYNDKCNMDVLENVKYLISDFGFQMYNIYVNAIKGKGVNTLDFVPFIKFSPKQTPTQSSSKSSEISNNYTKLKLSDNSSHSGLLFFEPTKCHCLSNLPFKTNHFCDNKNYNNNVSPCLIALLIHKWETPWAKLLPLRLLFRLGFEYKTYPYPLISILDRKSTFFEINHTIINLLADCRNFKYTLRRIPGLFISLSDKTVTITLSKINFKEVFNVANEMSSDHVLAFAGNFDSSVHAHLLCLQNESDSHYRKDWFVNPYKENEGNTTTAATFVVFNGSLKKSFQTHPEHKENCVRISLVEDGIIVHVTPQDLSLITNALKDMKEITLGESSAIRTLFPISTINSDKNRTISQEEIGTNKKELPLLSQISTNDHNNYNDNSIGNDLWYFDEDYYVENHSLLSEPLTLYNSVNKDLIDENEESSIIQSSNDNVINPKLEDVKDQQITNINNAENGVEYKDKLIIRWESEKQKVQGLIKIKSLIDDMELQNVNSFKPRGYFVDYIKKHLYIRLVEIYYIKTDAILLAKNDCLDADKLAQDLSKAFCHCIVNRLALLVTEDIYQINLRITVDSNKVGYELSPLGKKYQPYLTEIDDYLIPIIHSALNYTNDIGSLIIELVLHILKI